MSFLDFLSPSKKPRKEIESYRGLRYPSMLGELAPGTKSLLNFSIVDNVRQTYERDRSETFGQTNYLGVIQLYMPALEDNITNSYVDAEIGILASILAGDGIASATGAAISTLAGKALSGPGGAAVGGALGGSVSNTMSMYYESTNTREVSFQYDFQPKSRAELENVWEIIQTFRKYSLPSIDGNISYFPKFWAIEEQIIDPLASMTRVWKPYRFGPAALINVGVNYTPDQTWRTFSSGDPVHIILNLQFKEIFILSQEDIDTGGM